MLGVDLALWSAYALEGRAGRRDRKAYRDLAWNVARPHGLPRVEGDFDYYERMTHWQASGTFDSDPGIPGVQPETRTDTFNGDAWRLARALFLSGAEPDPGAPGYADALNYYQGRAYPDELLWDWSGAPGSQTEFSGLIRSSDDHLRRATWAVAGAIGNRFVSLLDLFITARTGGALNVRLEPGMDQAVLLSVRWAPLSLTRSQQ